MNFRTDLAVEAAVNHPANSEDVEQNSRTVGSLTLHTTRVLTPAGAAAVGKPRGRYLTVTLPSLTDHEGDFAAYATVIGRELAGMIPPEGTVLVVGLGNREVTPDALGPATAEMVLATRHIGGEFARTAGLTDLRPTAVIAPGVLGQTGTESSETVRGVCREIHPAAVIVVDALAAGDAHRLGRTVQLCDCGIAPGSGVGNNRRPLNREVLGVPVIGMGVPTVTDAVLDGDTLMVTPREVDVMIARAARLLAMSIHAALQPTYSPVELLEVARGM